MASTETETVVHGEEPRVEEDDMRNVDLVRVAGTGGGTMMMTGDEGEMTETGGLEMTMTGGMTTGGGGVHRRGGIETGGMIEIIDDKFIV